MKILNPYIIELAPTLSGHWYNVWEKNEAGGKGKFIGVFPSSTTILNAYPQSVQLTQWIAEKGWHESQRIKSEAGERGTRIHIAVEYLLDGKGLSRDNYSLEEWYKIKTFVDWHKEYKPEIIATEMKIFSAKHGYAGRLDIIAIIAEEIYVIDIKTSGSLYDHFPLQFASYAQAVEEMTDLKIQNTAALQLGAKRNKKGFRFVIYPDWRDHLDVFLHVKKTWEYDYGSRASDPAVLDLPNELKL